MANNSLPDFVIRPVTFRWATQWSPLYRKSVDMVRALPRPRTGRAILGAYAAWQQEADAWARGLSPDQQADVIDLLMAEADRLWNLIDPAAHAPSGYFPDKPVAYGPEWHQFRDRYHEAAALATAATLLSMGARQSSASIW